MRALRRCPTRDTLFWPEPRPTSNVGTLSAPVLIMNFARLKPFLTGVIVGLALLAAVGLALATP